MSSPFAYLLRETKKAKQEANRIVEQFVNSGMIKADDHVAREECFDKYFNMYANRTKKDIELMGKMKSIIKDDFQALISGGDLGKRQAYMITIRPDDTKCTFDEFRDKVQSFVRRACFIRYSYSFEQKGETIATMGKGFHVHIIADMKQRSKSEVLRDTLSSWNSFIIKGLISSNNIDVRTCHDPNEVVKNYLLEYKSTDEHKAKTKEVDYHWRSCKGLEPLYSNEDDA